MFIYISVDKFSKSRQHKRLITNHNVAFDDGERAYAPKSIIYPWFDVVKAKLQFNTIFTHSNKQFDIHLSCDVGSLVQYGQLSFMDMETFCAYTCKHPRTSLLKLEWYFFHEYMSINQ